MLPLLGRSITHRPEMATPIDQEDWYVPSEEELSRSRCESFVVEDFYKDLETPSIVTSAVVSNEDSNADSYSNFNSEVVIDNEDDVTFTAETNEIEFTEITDNNDSIEEISNDLVIESPRSILDYESALKRIKELEEKYEELKAKITRLESLPARNVADSDSSAFVNNFIGLMHETMKTGYTFQQKVLEKLCDEFDEMFDIDFTNFDPFKQ